MTTAARVVDLSDRDRNFGTSSGGQQDLRRIALAAADNTERARCSIDTAVKHARRVGDPTHGGIGASAERQEQRDRSHRVGERDL